MFEEVEDTKDWFVEELHIDTQEQILGLWSEGEAEELESRVGEERVNEFREMLQIVREAQSNSDLERDMIIQEMINEGFRKPIALTVYEEVEESVDARTDLMFMKRYLTVEEHRQLAQAAVDLYLGRRGESDILGDEGRLFQNEERDIDDINLLSRATRYMYSAIRNSVQELGGIARLKEGARDHVGYSEARIDAYFGPIEDDLPALQRIYYYDKIGDIEDEIDGLRESVTRIEILVSEMVD